MKLHMFSEWWSGLYSAHLDSLPVKPYIWSTNSVLFIHRLLDCCSFTSVPVSPAMCTDAPLTYYQVCFKLCAEGAPPLSPREQSHHGTKSHTLIGPTTGQRLWSWAQRRKNRIMITWNMECGNRTLAALALRSFGWVRFIFMTQRIWTFLHFPLWAKFSLPAHDATPNWTMAHGWGLFSFYVEKHINDISVYSTVFSNPSDLGLY